MKTGSPYSDIWERSATQRRCGGLKTYIVKMEGGYPLAGITPHFGRYRLAIKSK
jgi:hypothetical protein